MQDEPLPSSTSRDAASWFNHPLPTFSDEVVLPPLQPRATRVSESNDVESHEHDESRSKEGTRNDENGSSLGDQDALDPDATKQDAPEPVDVTSPEQEEIAVESEEEVISTDQLDEGGSLPDAEDVSDHTPDGSDGEDEYNSSEAPEDDSGEATPECPEHVEPEVDNEPILDSGSEMDVDTEDEDEATSAYQEHDNEEGDATPDPCPRITSKRHLRSDSVDADDGPLKRTRTGLVAHWSSQMNPTDLQSSKCMLLSLQ